MPLWRGTSPRQQANSREFFQALPSPSSASVDDGALAGQLFALDYPRFNPALATFYRLTTLDGAVITAMQAPTEESWTVPPAMTAASVAMQYLQLGIEHIIGGYDHLLFVLGLLVIAGDGDGIEFALGIIAL